MSDQQIQFDEQARTTFAGLADALIPEGDGMPSASQAGVAAEWLDAVLAARPELGPTLLALVRRLDGQDPKTAIAALGTSDPAAFGLLAEIVPNAYFMNREVRERVGYPGQVGLDVDLTWPPDWLDLLGPVIERGPIYRDPDQVAVPVETHS
jgi:hypothetical protein